MNSQSKNDSQPNLKKKRILEIVTALSFFIATLGYATGNSFLNAAILNRTGFTSLLIGSTLELTNTIAIIIIGICIWKLLNPYKSKLAKGYFFSRALEGIILAVGAVYVFIEKDIPIAELLHLREYTFFLAMFVLGIYSTYFFIQLLPNTFVPKWLNILGILGYIGLSIYALIGLIFGEQMMWLFGPGAIFEIVFPIYLLIKGTQPNSARRQ